MKIKYTSFPANSNWVEGLVNNGEYWFEAKLFNEGSSMGIDGGRVSKMAISYGNQWTGFDDCFAHYDRGWDIEPSNDLQEKVFRSVLHFLEESPLRDF